jgi:hypothetical protein
MTWLNCRMQWYLVLNVYLAEWVRQHLIGRVASSAGVPKAQLNLTGYGDG